jgi:glycosyltransferase involved in cell wall biosynthesis
VRHGGDEPPHRDDVGGDAVPVTLVVTVRNEARSLGDFARGVLAQTRPPDEIVLVDGGSTDGTAEIAAEVFAGGPPVRVVSAPGANIAAGRNIGVSRASHPLIAVTDAGTVADPQWLERLLEPFRRPDVDVAAGFFRASGRTRMERSIAALITPQLWEVEPSEFLPSSRSVAFRVEAWSRAGGYPEWLQHCEDLVFDLALRDSGARFAFAPGAVVGWSARGSLRAFARQYYLYARGDGHAGLWPRRHAARYSAYAVGAGLALAARRRPALSVPLAGGVAYHLSRYVRRVVRLRRTMEVGEFLRTLALAPVVQVTGDVAKMVGYPVGRVQRRAVRVRAT